MDESLYDTLHIILKISVYLKVFHYLWTIWPTKRSITLVLILKTNA
jgi:hypothetical protein